MASSETFSRGSDKPLTLPELAEFEYRTTEYLQNKSNSHFRKNSFQPVIEASPIKYKIPISYVDAGICTVFVAISESFKAKVVGRIPESGISCRTKLFPLKPVYKTLKLDHESR